MWRLAIAAGSVAMITLLASLPASAQQISACLRTADGILYAVAVGSNPSSECNPLDQIVSWNIQGPQGLTGPQGPTGPQGDEGPAGGSSSGGSLKFAGYSSTAFTPGTGYSGLNGVCQADFSDQSRACTSKEFVLSAVTSAPVNGAWLNPEIVSISNTDSSGQIVVLDFSGASRFGHFGGFPSDRLNCKRWTLAAGHGLAVTSTGGINTVSCGGILPVTCCAPGQ